MLLFTSLSTIDHYIWHYGGFWFAPGETVTAGDMRFPVVVAADGLASPQPDRPPMALSRDQIEIARQTTASASACAQNMASADT